MKRFLKSFTMLLLILLPGGFLMLALIKLLELRGHRLQVENLKKLKYKNNYGKN